MNVELLIKNINHLSENKGIKPTRAMIDSGAGKDFISNLLKGQTPSIEKVEKIAEFFNVRIGCLTGETQEKPANYDELSPEKQEFVNDVLALDDEDFQMIHDIFRTVRDRTSKRLL